jgi:hypothetical protein
MMPNDPGTPTESGASVGSLDFEHAEESSPNANACAQCATPITDRYYTIGEHVLCKSCQLAIKNAKAPGNAATRFLGAGGLGSVAAAVGCGVWMLVTELTGYEIGLIAIGVGYIVGMAVHIGSRGVGGLVYQLLAVFLAYSAIVMTYVPMLASELAANEDFQRGVEAGQLESEYGTPAEATEPAADEFAEEQLDPPVINPEESAWVAWVAAIPVAYAVPFLLGFENAIGILIIGFALWQAFRMNARQNLDLQGPFRLDSRDTALG